MKLKIDSKVYLQKIDVAHILHELKEVPASIFQEVFSNDEEGCFFMSSAENGLYFENVFERPDSVKWLMEQDWIINYDECVDTPLHDLEALHTSLIASYNAGINAFNAQDHEYKAKHYEEENEKYNKLAHKITSIECLIAFRKGETKFKFPPEYRDRTVYESPPKKKPSFFKRLFGYQAN